MSTWNIQLNKGCMLIYIILYLCNSFYPLNIFSYLLTGCAIFVILTGLIFMNSFNKYVSIILMGLGIIFLILNNVSLNNFCLGLIDNSGIVTLLLTIPILGFVFHYDNYEKYVLNLTMKYMNTELRFYTLTSFIISFFGVFMSLGSIPFVYQLLKKHSESFPEELFYKAIARGFFSNMLWAPSCIAIAVIIQYFETSWLDILPIGLLLTFLAHSLGIIIEKVVSENKEAKRELNISINTTNKYDSLRLFALIFILIAFVITFDLITKKGFLVIMPLVSITVPITLAIIYKKIDVFQNETKFYLESLIERNNEFILFTAIGFFGYALRFTDIGEYILIALKTLGFHTPMTLIPLFILAVVGLSIIGVHPIITISTIAVTLPIGDLPISPEQLSFSLLIGYSLYQLVSPFSTAVLVLTSITDKNPLSISLKINKLYVVCYIILATLLLLFL